MNKPKPCPICQQPFKKINTLQKTCFTPACAIEYGRSNTKIRDRAYSARRLIERKAVREVKERLKTRGDWAKEAQAVFNQWVRLRDKDEPCISCGRFHQGSYDAGHYRSIGASPALRFNELNCWKQCVPCNQHRSGNAIEYRLRLIEKIGAEKLAWLEGPHAPAKYSIDDLKAIKAHYRKLTKELKAQNETNLQ